MRQTVVKDMTLVGRDNLGYSAKSAESGRVEDSVVIALSGFPIVVRLAFGNKSVFATWQFAQALGQNETLLGGDYV
jgi:hypothetical protein